jgi:tRNA(Ile)-lysidine synthase
MPFAEGFVRLDHAALRAAPEEIALRALARIVTSVGGLTYVPRRESSEGLLAAVLKPLRSPRPGVNDAVLATLGGVLIVAESPTSLLFMREPAAVADHIPLAGPGMIVWDGRFRLHVLGNAALIRKAVFVGALGDRGARELMKGKKAEAAYRLAALPRRVRSTLPALLDGAGRPLALAEFVYGSYGRAGIGADSLHSGYWKLEAVFTPSLPLVGPGFMAGFILV